MAGTYGYVPQEQVNLGPRPVGQSAEPMMQPAYNTGRAPTAAQPQYRTTQNVKNKPTKVPTYQMAPQGYMTGELVAGVGITFAPNFEGHHVVTAIRPNSAAQLSRRILLGDIIQKVNKKPVQGLPTDHVVALLLGTPGTNVCPFPCSEHGHSEVENARLQSDIEVHQVELSVLDGTFQYLPPKLVLLQRTPLNYPGYGPTVQQPQRTGPARPVQGAGGRRV